MQSVHLHTTLEKDGVLTMTGLPCKKGQTVEIIVLFKPAKTARKRKYMTAAELLETDLVGLWKDRTDIGDSVEFARKLREKAQNRRHNV